MWEGFEIIGLAIGILQIEDISINPWIFAVVSEFYLSIHISMYRNFRYKFTTINLHE